MRWKVCLIGLEMQTSWSHLLISQAHEFGQLIQLLGGPETQLGFNARDCLVVVWEWYVLWVNEVYIYMSG
jgi:hypothetical protein